MDLTQYMCQHRELPTEMGWTFIFLIPKGNTYIRGIRVPKTFWKVVEAITNTCLKKCITFHDVLHGLYTGRVTGEAILYLKISQELAIIYQYPLFLVSLNLLIAYETLDHGRILTTLEGYGAGPNMCGILAEFWERKEVVTR